MCFHANTFAPARCSREVIALNLNSLCSGARVEAGQAGQALWSTETTEATETETSESQQSRRGWWIGRIKIGTDGPSPDHPAEEWVFSQY